MTVSYTHLSFGDEVLRLTGRKIAAVLPENAGIYRLDGDEFGIIVLGGDEEQCSDPVSYTHLDVYKRQIIWRRTIFWSSKRRRWS